TTTQPHILLVDDSRELRDAISRYLRANNYRVSLADSAAAARKLLKTNAIDLVVLDVMMPGEDGLSLCRDLRSNGLLPIIMLTARGEDVDRIVGLEMGADDYVSKPCNPRELIARITAVLRRASGAQRTSPLAGQRIRFEKWTLDVGRRELTGTSGVA